MDRVGFNNNNNILCILADIFDTAIPLFAAVKGSSGRISLLLKGIFKNF